MKVSIKVSNKDYTAIAKALKEAEALVDTLSKMVASDSGLLGIHAQDLQASALNIKDKLRLIQVVTTEHKE